jgi:hypothetical protein
VIVLVLFTIYQTYLGFMHPVLGSDQHALGIIVTKNLHPNLFAQDYAFKDSYYFRFYTPFYLRLSEWLTSYTNDFTQAILILMPFIMLAYLAGMYVLLFYISGRAWIALAVTLLSSLVWPTLGGDIWGVAELRVIIPRTLFLVLLPWLFRLMLHWLKSGQWWQWALLAFGVGLGTNLHPVSGMVFAELLLSLIVLFKGLNRKGLAALLVSVGAILVGAWPTMTNFFQETGSEYGEISFASFYQILGEQVSGVFLSEWNNIVLFGYQVGVMERVTLAWIYCGVMVIWCLFFLAKRLDRLHFLDDDALYLLLLLIQGPVVFYLTMFQTAMPIIITLLYWLVKSKKSEPDRIDLFCLAFLTLACVYAFLGSFFLSLVWVKFEVWRLTPLVMQQIRLSRFIYLPLFIFVARFIQLFVYHPLPSRRRIAEMLAVIGLIHFAPGRFGLPWAVLAGLLLVVELYGQEYLKKWWWSQLIFGIAVRTLIVRIILFIFLQTSQQWSLALSVAISYSLFNLWQGRRNYDWPTIGIRLGLASLPLVALLILGSPSLRVSWATELVAKPGALWAKVSPSLLSQVSSERRDELELYDWARTKTDIASLFYYDSLEFRFLAQRSLSHSLKDIGMGSYQGASLVEFNERYRQLQVAYEDATLLLRYARQYNVDFIVTTRQQGIELSLPVVFENATFLVYHFE